MGVPVSVPRRTLTVDKYHKIGAAGVFHADDRIELIKRDDVPSAGDVLLIVEIADTTLEYNRGTKVRLYARFGIPEVWLVDAQAETVSVYLDPDPKGDRRLLAPDKKQILTPPLMPKVKVALSDIWRK